MVIRALLIVALCISSTVVSVSAANVPYARSLTKRVTRTQSPRAVLEEMADSIDSIAGDKTCVNMCDNGICWYVALTLIILIARHYRLSQIP
jgi:hypothetical protein